MYHDAEYEPATEVESDRQQRVYRGQPSTIGQVHRDRDGLRRNIIMVILTKVVILNFAFLFNQTNMILISLKKITKKCLQFFAIFLWLYFLLVSDEEHF